MQKDRIVIPCHLSVFVYLFFFGLQVLASYAPKRTYGGAYQGTCALYVNVICDGMGFLNNIEKVLAYLF